MSLLSQRSFTSTRRIPEEHFVAAEREAAEARAKEAAGVSATPQTPPQVAPAAPRDRLDVLAHQVLPFVVVTAAAVWTTSSMLLWSTIEAPIAFASGGAVFLAGLSTVALVRLVAASFTARG